MFIFVAEEERNKKFWDRYQVMLQELLDGKRGGVYNGASLSISDYLGNTLCFSIGSTDKTNAPPEVLKLLGHLYIENKTPAHSHWNLAHILIAQ